MSARMISGDRDPVGPLSSRPVCITVDGEPVQGLLGQTIAGVVLANGRTAWRTTSSEGRPRGLFCGIGVCFDCIVTVNGARDVRACQRRAREGDEVCTQHDELPEAVDA